MEKEITSAFELHKPVSPLTPVLIDSPHSWQFWPEDVPVSAPLQAIMTSWDAWVDELWSGCIEFGIPLLAARFHRSLIDANRAVDDIDPELLDSEWPGVLNPTKKSEKGFGLIRRYALPGVAMYEWPLSVQHVQHRIQNYYEPYHKKISELIEESHQKFGFALHLNCHSMKSAGNTMNDDNGLPRPDIVISDRGHTTAGAQWTQWIAALFEMEGYHVTINTPYFGAALLARHGNPQNNIHSIQIEINRRLYMNEFVFEKTEDFAALHQKLSRIASAIATHTISLAEKKLPIIPPTAFQKEQS